MCTTMFIEYANERLSAARRRALDVVRYIRLYGEGMGRTTSGDALEMETSFATNACSMNSCPL